MMTVDALHRQAKTTTEDIFEHALSVLCKEFGVQGGTSEARKLAVDLAPVLAAMIQTTTTDLRTMLEHQDREADLEFRRNQADDL